MKKLLTIGASSSHNSINKKLVFFVASQIENSEIVFLDLNDFEMPIYSIDREIENGIHESANKFKKAIAESDAIIISLAEHNGSYTTAFKNILDWSSRLEGKLWSDKPMFLLSTSPGHNGASLVLDSAKNYFPQMGANIVASFSLPSFNNYYSEEGGIINKEHNDIFVVELEKFTEAIK